MVGRVLRKNGIDERDRGKKAYALIGFDELTESEINRLLDGCRAALADFISKRGDGIYAHRKNATGYISGTLRYEILKRQ